MKLIQFGDTTFRVDRIAAISVNVKKVKIWTVGNSVSHDWTFETKEGARLAVSKVLKEMNNL